MGIYLLANDQCGYVDSPSAVSTSTTDMDMHRNLRLRVDEHRCIMSVGNQRRAKCCEIQKVPSQFRHVRQRAKVSSTVPSMYLSILHDHLVLSRIREI